jgi:hypothetical protein
MTLAAWSSLRTFAFAVAMASCVNVPAIAGEPWAETRFGYGSYGLFSAESAADGGEIYLRDNGGTSLEGRLGYAGSSRWSPGLSVARYSAGRNGTHTSWALCAIAAYRSRRPELVGGLGVDFALCVFRADIDWGGGSTGGEGPVVASSFAIEPQVGSFAIPLFVGIRYAAIRNARVEVEGVTVRCALGR